MDAYNEYVPTQRVQNDGTPLGWKSCTCATGAVLEDGNTRGKEIVPWQDIRNATGDTVGGTSFDQIDAALAKLTGDDHLSTGYYTPDEVFHALDVEGKAFGAAIIYAPVLAAGQALLSAGRKNTISGIERGFASWHAETWMPKLLDGQTILTESVNAAGQTNTKSLTGPGRPVADPLCDGRRHTVAEGWVLYGDALMAQIIAASTFRIGGVQKLYGSLTLPWNLPKPEGVHLRTEWGAKLAYRGTWRITKPVAVRSTPWRLNSRDLLNISGKLVADNTFVCKQAVTHDNGVTFLGNATGDRWILLNRKRMEPVK